MRGDAGAKLALPAPGGAAAAGAAGASTSAAGQAAAARTGALAGLEDLLQASASPAKVSEEVSARCRVAQRCGCVLLHPGALALA